jgi:hypothetical protein
MGTGNQDKTEIRSPGNWRYEVSESDWPSNKLFSRIDIFEVAKGVSGGKQHIRVLSCPYYNPGITPP